MDFRATDPTVERLRVLLAPRRVRVVSAYVVNRSDTPIVIPTFSAERFDGRIATMERADADPLVGRAGIVLPASIPGNGAATVYLLTRERPEAVTAVVMHPAKGVSIRLSPQDG